MIINRRTFVGTSLGALCASALAREATATPGPDRVVQLWPRARSGLLDAAGLEVIVERSKDPALPDRAIERIRRPRMEVFQAKESNGAAVLVLPGGGYQRVVLEKEGHEVGAWLAAHGVTAFVLFYRLPVDGWSEGSNAPLADAQRAMRLIRADAAAYRVDPGRIAAMGFSAGGHLCADLATRFDRKTYDPVDAADGGSARPLLIAPVYPVISMDPGITHLGTRDSLIGKQPTPAMVEEYSPDKQVSAHTPPCFLVHAEDDPGVSVTNSLVFRAALKAAGIPVEMHLFESGGHGFGHGPRAKGQPVAEWGELWWRWARGHGLTR